MKVLHLISGGDTGGAKTHVLSLLSELNKEITAELVCYMEGEFSEEARSLGIPTTVYGGSFCDDLKKTAARIEQGGYELIHCHGAKANLIGSILKKRFSIPFISTVHSDYRLDYLGRPAARLTYGKLNAFALKQMDYLVCVSDTMRDTLFSRGFSSEKMFTIYNGVDFSAANGGRPRGEWLKKQSCSFTDEDIIVGIAARLDPVKDVKTLVRGFALASEKCARLRLFIAGDGQEMEMLRGLAAELGVSEKVFFAGWLNDAEEYYNAVDINTICSISETFPYAVTEAARAAKPTVGTRVGGIPKIVIPNETGFLFNPGDFEALAEHLVTLAENPELLGTLGKNMYEKALRDFSLESTRRRQLKIYSEILRGGRKLKRILICGAYGANNLGDEAMLKAIIDAIRERSENTDISVITRRPKETRRLHGVRAVYTFDLPRVFRELKWADVLLNGGGNLLQNVTSRRSLWYYLQIISSAKKMGCTVIMYGCGIGPVNGQKDYEKTAGVLNECVDLITLREPNSGELLKSMGVTEPEIRLAADPVLSIRPSDDIYVKKFFAQHGMDENGRYLCIGLRPWNGLDGKLKAIAEALRESCEKYQLSPVFLPMNRELDMGIAEQMAALIGLPHTILPQIDDIPLMSGILKRMQLTVSMRLHAIVLSASVGVPTVGISYDPKVSSFVEYTRCGSCIELEELTKQRLFDDIAKVLENESGEEREAHIRASRERESINMEMAARYMNLEEKQ